MYDKAKLDKLSGNDSTSRISYTPSLLKFNGSRGAFSLVEKTEKGYSEPTPLTTPLKVSLLRPRRICGWYEKTPDGKSISYFTNEHNNYADMLTLFSAEKGSKAKVVDTGTSSSLYEKYPLLRTSIVLYVLYDDVVHKLKIKGRSLKSFKKYREDLEKDGKAFYDFETSLDSKKEESQTFDFYSVVFSAEKETDFDKVGPVIEEVGTILNKIDEQHALNAIVSQDDVSASQGDASQPEVNTGEEVINVDEEPETLDSSDEIKVENIPF